jgi:hypothetical protein
VCSRQEREHNTLQRMVVFVVACCPLVVLCSHAYVIPYPIHPFHNLSSPPLASTHFYSWGVGGASLSLSLSL